MDYRFVLDYKRLGPGDGVPALRKEPHALVRAERTRREVRDVEYLALVRGGLGLSAQFVRRRVRLEVLLPGSRVPEYSRRDWALLGASRFA